MLKLSAFTYNINQFDMNKMAGGGKMMRFYRKIELRWQKELLLKAFVHSKKIIDKAHRTHDVNFNELERVMRLIARGYVCVEALSRKGVDMRKFKGGLDDCVFTLNHYAQHYQKRATYCFLA